METGPTEKGPASPVQVTGSRTGRDHGTSSSLYPVKVRVKDKGYGWTRWVWGQDGTGRTESFVFGTGRLGLSPPSRVGPMRGGGVETPNRRKKVFPCPRFLTVQETPFPKRPLLTGYVQGTTMTLHSVPPEKDTGRSRGVRGVR